MYHSAQLGWHEKTPAGFTIWARRFDVQIDVDPSRMTRGSRELETNNVVSGMYETIVDVAATSRFCGVVSTLFIYGRKIGTLRIGKVRPGGGLEGEIPAANSTLVKDASRTNGITYPSGHYDDPDDVEFIIDYTYAGTRINSRDIFLAVIDALATCARFDPGQTLTSFHALSPLGDCVISVDNVDGPFKINYSFVTKALTLMVTDIMIELGKFEEITLRLMWQGSLTAEVRVKPAGQGVGAQ